MIGWFQRRSSCVVWEIDTLGFLRSKASQLQYRKHIDTFIHATDMQWGRKNPKKQSSTFSVPAKFSRSSTRGFTYWAKLVIWLGSVGSIPEPARSTAVATNPDSSSNAIDLYQHHAPSPPPCTRTKCFDSKVAAKKPSCKAQHTQMHIYFQLHLTHKEHNHPPNSSPKWSHHTWPFFYFALSSNPNCTHICPSTLALIKYQPWLLRCNACNSSTRQTQSNMCHF